MQQSKWHLVISMLMVFLVAPPQAAASDCSPKGSFWCNALEKAASWNIFGYDQKRKPGRHRGIVVPLLANDHAVLKSGKKIVYFGWPLVKDSPYYHLKVKGDNGKTWETPPNYTSTFVEIKKNQFKFEAGEYLVAVSSFVKDGTGKPTKKTIEHTLTVSDRGCNAYRSKDFKRLQRGLKSQRTNEPSKKKAMALWLMKQSSECWLEAYQYLAGEESLKDEKSALADGKCDSLQPK